MLRLLVCLLLRQGSADLELCFLQTERYLQPTTPWLQPAVEHLRVPDFFRHAAVPTASPALSPTGALGIGLGVLVVITSSIWILTARDEVQKAPQRWRSFTLLMCMLVFLLNYADRYNISVAILEISAEKGIDKKLQGLIQSAVYLGLLPGTVSFGHLASPDVLGPFSAMLVACLGWSLATLATPLCTDTSVGLLVLIRITLGFFEAGSSPCIYQMAVNWFPKVQSSHLIAAGVAGQCAGAAIANAFGPLAEKDWRIVFYIFGAAGLLWCSIFGLLGASSPEEHRYVSQEEVLAIRASQGQGEASASTAIIPQRLLLTHPAVLGLMVGEAASAFMWYFWLSWMPSFFHDNYGLSTGDAGSLGMMAYLMAIPAPFIWSQLFSACFQGKPELLRLRGCFVGVTFLGSAVVTLAMLLSYSKISAVLAATMVMVIVLCLTSKVAGLSSLVVDCGGSNAARVGGLTHAASALCGSVSNLLVGYFLATPSLGYQGVFVLSIILALLGFVVVVQTAQADPIQKGDVQAY